MSDKDAVFIDTWAWFTLCSSDEARHEALKAHYRGWIDKGQRLVTTDWILAESGALIFKRVPFERAKDFFNIVFDSMRCGELQIERISEKRFNEVWKLRLKLKDKPDISFVDLSSFVVMKELSISRVATADQHFAHVGMGFVLCN
jgi:predicted nucleic acid-binding protein